MWVGVSDWLCECQDILVKFPLSDLKETATSEWMSVGIYIKFTEWLNECWEFRVNESRTCKKPQSEWNGLGTRTEFLILLFGKKYEKMFTKRFFNIKYIFFKQNERWRKPQQKQTEKYILLYKIFVYN